MYIGECHCGKYYWWVYIFFCCDFHKTHIEMFRKGNHTTFVYLYTGMGIIYPVIFIFRIWVVQHLQYLAFLDSWTSPFYMAWGSASDFQTQYIGDINLPCPPPLIYIGLEWLLLWEYFISFPFSLRLCSWLCPFSDSADMVARLSGVFVAIAWFFALWLVSLYLYYYLLVTLEVSPRPFMVGILHLSFHTFSVFFLIYTIFRMLDVSCFVVGGAYSLWNIYPYLSIDIEHSWCFYFTRP